MTSPDRATAEAEARFRSFAELSLQGVVLHDGERVLLANEAYARMYGYPDVASVLAGLDFGNHIFEEDRPPLVEEWHALLAGRLPISRRRHRRRRRDRSVFWIEQVMSAVDWEGRRVIQSVQIDITREVEAEAGREDSEARFRALAAESLQGIVIHDGRRCLFANDGYARAMGFPDAETAVAEIDVRALVEPEQLPAVQAEWEALLAGRATWVRERVRRRRRDGTPVWLDTLRGPVVWSGRRAIQVFQYDVTREMAAEAELRRSEARFRAVIDHLPVGFSLKDADRRVLLVNRTFESWYDMPAAELVGRRHEDLEPARWAQFGGDENRIADEAVLAGGATTVRHRSRHLPDGSRRDLLISKFPVQDDAGVVIGTIITDVTALKEAEEALTRREESLRRDQVILARIIRESLLGGASHRDTLGAIARFACTSRGLAAVSINTYDLESPRRKRDVIAHYDARANALLALPPEPLDSVYGWFTPAHLERIRHDFLSRIDDVATDPRVTAAGRAHFAQRRIGASLSALIRLPDLVNGLVALSHEAAHAWSAEDEAFARSLGDLVGLVFLLERHRQSLAALDLVDQGIYVEDDGGRVLFANRAARLLARAGQDGLPRAADLPGAAAAAGTATPVSWAIADGRARDLAVTRSALPGGGSVTVIADVTEQNRREREHRALEASTRQLAKLEAVGRLAGGIAHDFNNILGTVMGFASFLAEDLPADGALRDYAERILRASEHGKAVVQQLLAFTRAGEVERSVADLAALVDESSELMRAALPSSTRFVLDLGAEPLPVLVNVSQVHQVLLNLCLNANDALGGEPGTVRITLTRVAGRDAAAADGSTPAGIGGGLLDAGQDYACLTVTDTGAGMDAETLARMFEPFFTTKMPGRGTGLGLAVVHGIINAYEGAYRVESLPGRGTRFAIYLPVVAPEAPRAADAPADGVRPDGRESVLLVDDEQHLLQMLQIGLERLGYAVTAYSDPVEALRAFDADPARWSVIVTDQVMPGMKGSTLIRTLREIRPGCPAILCTGFSDGAIEQEAAEAGAGAFFLKPVEPRRVAEAIRALLDPAAGA